MLFYDLCLSGTKPTHPKRGMQAAGFHLLRKSSEPFREFFSVCARFPFICCTDAMRCSIGIRFTKRRVSVIQLQPLYLRKIFFQPFSLFQQQVFGNISIHAVVPRPPHERPAANRPLLPVQHAAQPRRIFRKDLVDVIRALRQAQIPSVRQRFTRSDDPIRDRFEGGKTFKKAPFPACPTS